MVLRASFFVVSYFLAAACLQAACIPGLLEAPKLLSRTIRVLGAQCPAFRGAIVNINEVGPRDGIQGIKGYIDPERKDQFLRAIIGSIKPIRDNMKALPVRVEMGSIVSPDAVPQMKSTEELLGRLKIDGDLPIIYSVLIPNLKGMNRLKAVLEKRKDGLVPEVAVFVSPSEPFSKANLKCSVSDSLKMVESVLAEAKRMKLLTRGFISMVSGSPFGDVITKDDVKRVAIDLRDMGCQQIVLGDTTGSGTPSQIYGLIQHLKEAIPVHSLALHLHGRADNSENTLQNVLAAYIAGIRSFDGSVGGIGGCPYSPGSPGNLDTVLLLQLFHQLGAPTSWDLKKVSAVRAQLPEILDIKI